MDNLDLMFNEAFIKSKLKPFNSSSRITLKDPFFTSSAILFPLIPHEEKPYKLLLIHRSNRGLRHRGEISFPGGKYDPKYDKSLMDTALRETKEEIGVPNENVKIIGCLDDFPTMTKFIITPFISIINKNQKLKRDEREVQRILKIPIDFFVKKINFREQSIDIENSKFPIFYFNYLDEINGNKYTIWGATAYMIVSFIETIYGFTLSKLGLKRFKLEKVKHLKEYIKYRNQITSKF